MRKTSLTQASKTKSPQRPGDQRCRQALAGFFDPILPTGALALLMLTGSALAVEGADQQAAGLVHHCVRGDGAARVEVVPERVKGELPCRVMFFPETGAPETLWQVQFERGLCVRKADRKRDILAANGWRCETSINAPWASAASPARRSDGAAPSSGANAASDRKKAELVREKVLDAGSSHELEVLLSKAAPGQEISLALEEAVSLALRNNRGIESGYLTRIRDTLGLEQAEDQFWPDLTIDGGPDWTNSGGATGTLSSTISNALPTGGALSLSWANQLDDEQGIATLSADVTQPLWRGAGLDANLADLRQARIDFDIGELALSDTVIGTVSNVIQSHRGLNLAQIQIEVAERALKRANEQKRVSQMLFEAGRIPRVDTVQNDAEIASREVALTSTQLALDNARRSLLELLNIETRAVLLAEASTTSRDVTIDVKTALAIAFANRPDFLSAQLSYQATRLGLEVARSQERWGVDAVVGADYQDSLYSSIPSFGDDNDVNYRAGLRLNVPFGDVGRRQSVKLARLDIQGTELSLIELQNSIENEIANLIANISTLKSQIALAERAETLANDQLRAERIKFSRGLSSTLDLISLEDALVDAQLATFQSRVDYSNALTDLDQALGMTLKSWAIELNETGR